MEKQKRAKESTKRKLEASEEKVHLKYKGLLK